MHTTASSTAAPTKIVRVIARMNVGGPALEVCSLMRGLDPVRFPQILVTGFVSDGEADYLDTQAQDVGAIRLTGLGRAVRPLDDLRALLSLVRLLHREKPTIVHTHTAKAGVLGRLASLTLIPRPKVVHTFHGHVLSGYFSTRTNRIIAWIERLLAWTTDELVTVGPEVRDEILGAGIGKVDHFHVIPPGVALKHRPERATARRMLEVPVDAEVISVVGRLTRIKRPDRMLDVVAQVAPAHPKLLVLVAGDGDLHDEVVARIARERLPVRLLGWTDDVETVFAASDLTLLTSDNEGTPISLMQAALLGIPAVATNVGSVGQIVEDGKTGWLNLPDTTLLSGSVREALEQADERLRRGTNAMRRAQSLWAAERYVRDYVALYEKLAAPAGRS